MKVLGITGGVGCGKSRILEYLRTEYGAEVCQLDEIAKRLQQKGERCYERITEVFGSEILMKDGELDRALLAKIVFADKKKLQTLNEIVHPEVKRFVSADIERYRNRYRNGAEHKRNLYVIEAALLPTAGYEEICDEMWYIYVEESVRRKRLRESRGYTEEKITAMIASQPSERVFQKACGAVIDNSGAWEDTMKQIGELLL